MSALRKSRPLYVADAGALAYVPTKVQVICGPHDVLVALKSLKLAEAMREHFVALLLNARYEVMRVEVISVGSLNASIVHPREVFRPAVVYGAAAVVLAHNHPSGDPEPSDEDKSITHRLVEVGNLLGVLVLDHVIIGSRGLVSFRARQLI